MNEKPGMKPIRLKCGAKNRQGKPCGNKPLPNGRCKFHGGMSTGPKTPEGIAAIRASRTKHGAYSAEMKHVREMLKVLKAETKATRELVK